MMEGTRATTYDNAALQSNGFKCAVYEINTITPYIASVNVNWGGSGWAFSDGSHEWHPDGTHLDFFAYSPQTIPSYIDIDSDSNPDVTYAVNGTPSPAPHFSCTMPINLTPADATQEFVWALTADQSKEANGSGVTMTFRRPFACIRFKLSEASGTNVRVNSISIPGIYTSGTCTLTGTGGTATSTWSSLSGNSNPLTITGSPATSDDAVYLVIPYNYGSQTLTVNATWTELSAVENVDVSASVNFNWEAGHSYTYTLKLKDYILIVDTDKFTEQW